MAFNRTQRRSKGRRSQDPWKTPEGRRVARYARQLFVWRYCENHWWRMSTGWGFRGIVPERLKPEAHNAALVLDLHWQAISVTYLRDSWGKEYRQFGFARTGGTLKGFKQGICPLLDETLATAEDGVNTRHIYGRAMVFAPWTENFNSLAPILAIRKKALRLHDADIAAISEEEQNIQRKSIYVPDPFDIDSRIAALLEDA